MSTFNYVVALGLIGVLTGLATGLRVIRSKRVEAPQDRWFLVTIYPFIHGATGLVVGQLAVLIISFR